ncbi:Cell division protein BolA [Georgfuchsia toluolica]|uniref:Cell division protein BolA n=1 Tax=Georgfuchsia toluolica TaxID=424218 RepID=A0A916J1M3_9PROT|nr:BolA family protein [Georgfuchsia toluolica]CAG4882344.1 Cell division protein BolA [Georgfuchsia toluolica]
MTSTIDQMRERLSVLEPHVIDITDESALHAGHVGARSGGGHYRMAIVSPRFAGMATMARHRLVYDALGLLMRHEIHALSITAKTPEEI